MTKQELIAEFEKDFLYVEFGQHTCETWNDLGDEMQGQTSLSTASKVELKAFILKAFEAGEQAERERLIQSVKDYIGAQDPTCFSPEGFDLAYAILSFLTKDV